jgi:hypothetical protein
LFEGEVCRDHRRLSKKISRLSSLSSLVNSCKTDKKTIDD